MPDEDLNPNTAQPNAPDQPATAERGGPPLSGPTGEPSSQEGETTGGATPAAAPEVATAPPEAVTVPTATTDPVSEAPVAAPGPMPAGLADLSGKPPGPPPFDNDHVAPGAELFPEPPPPNPLTPEQVKATQVETLQDLHKDAKLEADYHGQALQFLLAHLRNMAAAIEDSHAMHSALEEINTVEAHFKAGLEYMERAVTRFL